MKFIVGIIILVLILFVIFSLFQKRSTSQSAVNSLSSQEIKQIKFESEPDLPIGFGYNCQWFVVKTTDTKALQEAINLKNVHVSNWKTGIEGSYEGYYFISPPINGWTFIINSNMPDLSGKESPYPLTVITDLSQRFGEAYYFGTHRIVDYHAWAKAVNGKVLRAYSYLGESGETIINEGDLSQEERENNLFFTNIDVGKPKLPNEEDVLLIAKKWTIDPLMQEGSYHIGAGYVGLIE